MELYLGLFFLTVLSFSTISVECRNLEDPSRATRSSYAGPSSKIKRVYSKVDRQEASAYTQDLPDEFVRQSDPSKRIIEQVSEFLDVERCGYGCRQRMEETTTSEKEVATTEEMSVSTTDLPTAVETAAFNGEGNTIVNDVNATTTEASLLKYNTTCTDAECLTVVSSPDRADVTLRYRCVAPRRCGSISKQSNNMDKKANTNYQDKISMGGGGGGGGGREGEAQGSSGYNSNDNTHGSSNHGSASLQTQSSSGYSLPNRHNHYSHHASHHIIGGDHTYSSSSHGTHGNHEDNSSSQITISEPHTSAGSSSHGSASHQTQSSSGYSLPNRHNHYSHHSSNHTIGGDHTYSSSSHGTQGDHKGNSSSQITIPEPHTSAGSSSHGSASHQTQSSSGYSLPNRHNHYSHHSSHHIIEGDHKNDSSSQITVLEPHTSAVSQSNKGQESKDACCTPQPNVSPHDSSSPESADSTPIYSTLKPENAGEADPSIGDTAGGSKPSPVVNGSMVSAKPSGGYGGISSGKKPGYGAFSFNLNYPATTQRTTTAKIKPQEVQSNLPETIPTPPNCGFFNDTLFRRIKGGTPSTVGKWPWMVAYGYGFESDGEVTWMCAGALVTVKSSITAAHCLDHPTMKLKLARFGDLDLDDDDDGATHVTEEVLHGIKHPMYNKREFNHDIGIVVIKKPLTFTSTIKPICLPFGQALRNEAFAGMEPYVAGWGMLDFQSGGTNSLLYEAQVAIVSNIDCAKTYSQKLNKTIRHDHICAGGEGGRDTCQGDSGGPLMVPWNQFNQYHFYTIGVVSWGFRCGTVGYPGVYTRVTSYLDWLRLNLV